MGWGGGKGNGGSSWDWSGGGWGGGGWSGGGWSNAAWSSGCWNGGSDADGSRRGKGGGKSAGGRKGKGGGADVPAPTVGAAAAELVKRMKVDFCPDPTSLGGKFTTTYDAKPTTSFASLNAGDMRFMVGGATMNKQFAVDLEKYGGQKPAYYKDTHHKLFSLPPSSDSESIVAATAEVLVDDPNLQAAYRRLMAPKSKVGVVFIDIFKEERRPHSANNVAMVYTIGPQRTDCASDMEFLGQVQALAANVSAACAAYNAMTVAPPIETLRVCLVSGGAFAGGVPKRAVASHICLGLAEGLAGVDDGAAPTFQFAFDGNVFHEAWTEISDLAAKAPAEG